MTQLNELLDVAIKACIEAGIKTLTYYSQNFEVNFKKDNSPLTEADTESNKIINQALVKTGIPIVSEENKEVDYSIRKHWNTYWLVDPLDGTKEFVNKNGEFTINIALIENGIPVLGVVFIPVSDKLYYAASGYGSYKLENVSKSSETLPFESKIKLPYYEKVNNNLVVVASRSHINTETDKYIKDLEQRTGKIEIKNFGSSLKLCMLAEGGAHIYPRMAPTMEWDIAAGHAVLLESGGNLVQYPSYNSFEYNKENLLNPSFVAYCKGYELYK